MQLNFGPRLMETKESPGDRNCIIFSFIRKLKWIH